MGRQFGTVCYQLCETAVCFWIHKIRFRLWLAAPGAHTITTPGRPVAEYKDGMGGWHDDRLSGNTTTHQSRSHTWTTHSSRFGNLFDFMSVPERLLHNWNSETTASFTVTQCCTFLTTFRAIHYSDTASIKLCLYACYNGEMKPMHAVWTKISAVTWTQFTTLEYISNQDIRLFIAQQIIMSPRMHQNF